MTTIRYEPATEFILTPNQVRHIRVMLGFNKRELAEKMGVTHNSVWRWEKGMTILSGDNAYKLAAMAAQGGIKYE